MSRILITGSSGFLGKRIMKAFAGQGTIDTIGRDKSNSIVCDLGNEVPKLNAKYDLVIHAAGKAHMIPKTEEEKAAFFATNANGTANLLNALDDSALPSAFVFISTVSVYGLDAGENISEESELKGDSPYALSKIKAEQLLKNWADRNHVPLLVLRLPLLVGENPPGNLGDMIKGIRKGRYLSIGKATARKSMVLAQDVADFIRGWKLKPGTYNLSDGYHPSFGELEKLIAQQLNKKKPMAIPMWIAKLIGIAGDIIPGFPVNSNKLRKITSTLTFSDQKARKEQDWKPHQVLEHFRI